MNIEPHIFEKSKINGFNFYKYLHIRGGSGIKPGHTIESRRYTGGEYDFIAFYASNEDMINKPPHMCDRLWCIEANIVFGEGPTLEAAYTALTNKLNIES